MPRARRDPVVALPPPETRHRRLRAGIALIALAAALVAGGCATRATSQPAPFRTAPPLPPATRIPVPWPAPASPAPSPDAAVPSTTSPPDGTLVPPGSLTPADLGCLPPDQAPSPTPYPQASVPPVPGPAVAGGDASAGRAIAAAMDRLGTLRSYRFLTGHAGQFVALVLDGVVLTTQEVRGLTADFVFVFTGDYTTTEARTLAMSLYRDPLPFPVRLVEDVEIPAS